MNPGRIGRFAYVRDSKKVDVIVNYNVAVGTTLSYTFQVANYSLWLDYAAWIRIMMPNGQSSRWHIKYHIDEVDITKRLLSDDGYTFVRQHRLRPSTIQSIHVSFTRTRREQQQNVTLVIELALHRGSQAIDSLRMIV